MKKQDDAFYMRWAWGQAFTGYVLVLLSRLITGVQVRWQGSTPQAGARVYYGNHSSNLDGLVIWSGLPKEIRPSVHPIAARDYWDATALKRYIAKYVFRALLIDRQKPSDPDAVVENPIEAMGEILARDEAIIIFPEGTRNLGEGIGPFKSGLYHLMKQHPQAEFIPVYLENLNRVLPKGTKLIVPIICSATFGAPIAPLAADEDRHQFLARAQQALQELAP
ncbi:MAG: 1-acyl-sn-glycerol-3-phosphate acyltransferase [Neisseriaceae bacterium]|nr:1-acyl-sn-glycerol-3-phosphate acyltransferase [Neisseriaceae bacterium]